MRRAAIIGLALVGAALSPLALAKETPPNPPPPVQNLAERPDTDAQIDYQGFQNLTGEVNSYRQGRLVNLTEFQRLAVQGALILDARSADAYARGHIAGAVNLPFTDFTDQSLRQAIGATNRPVLIYCNNNFENNAPPVMMKRVQLALNIQTFINLYGYGYRNVYELGDVVNFDDPAVRWVRG